MQRLQYNPTRELQKIESDLDMLWSSFLPSCRQFYTGNDGMNMYVEEGKLITEFALPYFKKDEVNASVRADILEVTAEHKIEKETGVKRLYLYREINTQYFRRVTLPAGAIAEDMTAVFKDGMLTVTMPYSPEQESTKLHVD